MPNGQSGAVVWSSSHTNYLGIEKKYVRAAMPGMGQIAEGAGGEAEEDGQKNLFYETTTKSSLVAAAFSLHDGTWHSEDAREEIK